jgi:hypothetical protein
MKDPYDLSDLGGVLVAAPPNNNQAQQPPQNQGQPPNNSSVSNKFLNSLGFTNKAVNRTPPGIEYTRQLGQNLVSNIDRIIPESARPYISDIAQNREIQASLGAGDTFRNDIAHLANLMPGTNIPIEKSGEGFAYDIGGILTDAALFGGAGEGLMAARGAAEKIPLIGKIAEALGKEGSFGRDLKQNTAALSGLSRRGLGSAGYGALTSEGRRGEGATTAAELSAALDALPVAGKIAGKVGQAFMPEKLAKEIMGRLGAGQSFEENAQSLANILKNKYEGVSSGNDKLYNRVFDSFRDTDVYGELVKKSGRLTKSRLNELAKESPVFNDAVSLRNQYEDEIKSLKSEEKLSPRQQKKLSSYQDEMYTLDNRIKSYANSSYHGKNNKKFFDDLSPQLEDLHQEFIKTPTLENAHELQNKLTVEAARIRKSASPNTDRAERYEKAQKLLKQDIHNMLGSKSPKALQEYKEATEDFYNNVLPYRQDKDIHDIATGKIQNPHNITSIFKAPEKDILKISEDIGQAGKNRVLYEELGGANQTAKQLADAISKLDKRRLSSYADEKLLQDANSLTGKIARKDLLQKGLGALIGGAIAYPIASQMPPAAMSGLEGIGLLAGAALAPRSAARMGKNISQQKIIQELTKALNALKKPTKTIAKAYARKKALTMELPGEAPYTEEMEY